MKLYLCDTTDSRGSASQLQHIGDFSDGSPWVVCMLLGCALGVQPIRWMQEVLRVLVGGELDYRIPSRRHDELGDLSRDINEMAEDVQGMLEAKRQLMLAISHELRSPFT